MDRIKFIPGIQWAVDVFEGRRPIPTYQGKKESSKGFKDILDEETRKIKERNKG